MPRRCKFSQFRSQYIGHLLKTNRFSHCAFFSVHLRKYRLIKSPAPPYPAKRKNAPEKLSIAFSNTTYLNIIWRVSCSTIDYLRLSDSFCKMSSIYFWTFWAFLVSSSTSSTAAQNFVKSDQTKYQWGFMIILLC